MNNHQLLSSKEKKKWKTTRIEPSSFNAYEYNFACSYVRGGRGGGLSYIKLYIFLLLMFVNFILTILAPSSESHLRKLSFDLYSMYMYTYIYIYIYISSVCIIVNIRLRDEIARPWNPLKHRWKKPIIRSLYNTNRCTIENYRSSRQRCIFFVVDKITFYYAFSSKRKIIFDIQSYNDRQLISDKDGQTKSSRRV